MPVTVRGWEKRFRVSNPQCCSGLHVLLHSFIPVLTGGKFVGSWFGDFVRETKQFFYKRRDQMFRAS